MYNYVEGERFVLDDTTYERDDRRYDEGDAAGNVVSIAVKKNGVLGDIIAATGEFKPFQTD